LISLFLSERKECSSAIMKNSKFNEQQKDKWLSIITNDMMSSEESGPDDSIIVHPLPWRSQHVDNMFEKVDRYNDGKRSPQARRQMKRRILGDLSSREAPQLPKWATR